MKIAGLLLTNLRFPVASAKLIPASASLSLAEGPRKGATTMRMASLSAPHVSWIRGSRTRPQRSANRLTCCASTGRAFTSTIMLAVSPWGSARAREPSMGNCPSCSVRHHPGGNRSRRAWKVSSSRVYSAIGLFLTMRNTLYYGTCSCQVFRQLSVDTPQPFLSPRIHARRPPNGAARYNQLYSRRRGHTEPECG